jgi:hypothetical protein
VAVVAVVCRIVLIVISVGDPARTNREFANSSVSAVHSSEARAIPSIQCDPMLLNTRQIEIYFSALKILLEHLGTLKGTSHRMRLNCVASCTGTTIELPP